MKFDIDDVMRKLQGGVSKRPPIGRWLLLAAVAVVVLIGVFTCYYTVEPEGRAVVKRFGRVVKIVDPGLHFKWPFGIETAEFVPTERVLKEEFGFRTAQAARRSSYRSGSQAQEESLMLTGDLNVVDVEWVVQYRIRDPEHYLHNVRDREDTIRDVAEAVMRRVVGNRLASDVLTVGRVAIAAEVRQEMQEVLDSYEMGLQITGVELQDVTPPDPVKPAFNQVNEARQQKERLVNLAEKERNQVLPRAEGEAAQTIAEAEAYATERVNQARGETARFTALFEKYAQAPEVTKQRMYLETLDELGPQFGGVYVIGSGTSPLPLINLLNGQNSQPPAPAPAPRKEQR